MPHFLNSKQPQASAGRRLAYCTSYAPESALPHSPFCGIAWPNDTYPLWIDDCLSQWGQGIFDGHSLRFRHPPGNQAGEFQTAKSSGQHPRQSAGPSRHLRAALDSVCVVLAGSACRRNFLHVVFLARQFHRQGCQSSGGSRTGYYQPHTS
jgi:hypothetical protein